MEKNYKVKINPTQKLKLTYEDMVKIVVQFLEEQQAVYIEELNRHIRDYNDDPKEYIREDIIDTSEYVKANRFIINFYKGG